MATTLLHQKLAGAVQNSRTALSFKPQNPCLERTLTSYSKVISPLPKTYAIVDGITKMYAEILQLPEPSNIMPTEYSRARRDKTLSCDLVNDEYVLEWIFTEKPHS